MEQKIKSRSIKSNFDLRLSGICLFKLRAQWESALAFMGLHYGNSLPWLKHRETQLQLFILGLRATTDECNINKLLQSKQTEKARQRSKQIWDEAGGIRGGREGGSDSEGLPCLSLNTIQVHGDAWPSIKFWAGAPFRLPNVMGSALCAKAKTRNPSWPQGKGEIVLWHRAINCLAK